MSSAELEAEMFQVEGFNVRLVFKGMFFGRNDCVEHEKDEPLVEFYDSRTPMPNDKGRGQFVSRYYLSTLLESNLERGLCLDTGAPHWSVSPKGCRAVKEFLRDLAHRIRGTVVA